MTRSLLALSCLLLIALPTWAAEPTITFTEVPEAGQGSASQGNIAGKVANLHRPEQYKIVLYAHADKWYVQPEVDNPFTDIGPDGTWSNWTHLGYRYAALVVRPDFHPAPNLRTLPPIGLVIIAKKEVPAQKR